MHKSCFGPAPELKRKGPPAGPTRSASQIRKGQMSGSAMNSVLRPIDAHKEDMMRRGVKEVDYLKQNSNALKQKQKQNREDQIERKMKANVVPFKIKRFQNAKPCVNVRRSAKEDSTLRSAIPEQDDEVQEDIPDNCSEPHLAESLDYQSDGEPVSAASSPKVHHCEEASPRAEEGFVQLEHPDISVPPGHRVLLEAEREAALKALHEKKEVAAEEHRKLPLLIETDGQKRRQIAIEKKLQELESAIADFRHPVVVVEN